MPKTWAIPFRSRHTERLAFLVFYELHLPTMRLRPPQENRGCGGRIRQAGAGETGLAWARRTAGPKACAGVVLHKACQKFGPSHARRRKPAGDSSSSCVSPRRRALHPVVSHTTPRCDGQRTHRKMAGDVPLRVRDGRQGSSEEWARSGFVRLRTACTIKIKQIKKQLYIIDYYINNT